MRARTYSFFISHVALTFLIGGLAIFGLIMLSSASAPIGFQKFSDSYFYLKKQIFFGFLPGIIGFFFLSRYDYQKLKKFGLWFFLFSIFLLCLVFIPGLGAEYGTARSWLNVGGFSFQPAELVKLFFLIYVAAWCSERRDKELKTWKEGFLPFLFSTGIIATLIMLQPDFGTLFIILLMIFSVYFVAGLAWRDIVLLLGVAVFGVWGVIRVAPYRAARILTFLHPDIDPQGVGYHIRQALIAIGGGGWIGVGLGQSRQKFLYLPEVAGDSIFAIIAEELGFLFTVFVPLAFLALAYFGLQVAMKSRDHFGKYLATGIVAWLVFQAFVNMGAMVGLLPITGLPLPFMSYGGTALLVSFLASGILVNIAKHV